MANKRVNFVEQTTATTGTGSITLVAKAGFAKASDGLAVGETAEYYLKNGNDREYGIGTMQASGVFDRTTVKSTLIAGVYDDTTATAITLVGTSDFGLSPGAEDLMNKSNTSIEGALWKVGVTIYGNEATRDTTINLGGSGCVSGVSGQQRVRTTILNGVNQRVTGNDGFIGAGGSNTAGLLAAVLQGTLNTGSGTYSLIGNGYSCSTTGSYSVVVNGEQCDVLANFGGILSGQGCRVNTGHTNAQAGGGGADTRAAFDIVYGNVVTSTPNVANNTIRFEVAAGNIKIDGAVSSPEAGIGECVEWLDGNPNAVDRTGLGVSFSNGKLIVGGDKIRGVVSQTCGLISNDVPNSWHGKYLRDNFKRKLWVEYEVLNWVDEWGDGQTTYKLDDVLYAEMQNPVNPAGIATAVSPIGNIEYSTVKVRLVNPLYDAAHAGSYKARSERPEWGVVETDGQPWARAAEEILSEFVDFNLEGKVVNGTTYPVMGINGNAIQIWFKGT